ncbi:hypothetical protein Alches_16170 [Alicyclobacillus hesperidum subsp. aegles]|uniref:hypothetical protein n=1 Tax=Alicyclobacillus hesperidum TaxID=89784 RepID=UPI002228BE79|nr:hypothetical protein [Alicyclobacillus hesperidum]GLG01577.1 hypothetical protein Alches_16170 [Alicyclobacillus hesperidum subsp. aegles]
MTTKENQFDLNLPQVEEDEPFESGFSPPNNPPPDDLDIEKLERQENVAQKAHKRAMELAKFNSISKLLGWCIFLVFLIYILEIFIFHKDSLSSSLFDLLKTIIVAAVGYILGQKSNDSG